MIETERLYLIPLTAGQLELFIEGISAIEKELSCIYRGEPLEGHFLDILKEQSKTAADDEANYLYHSSWLLMRKADRIVVGSADFKGLPDENGEVEIGYGLGKDYEHNGYMTEAVRAMCDWAMQQEKIKHVIAETYTDNIPSQRILQRCSFEQFKHGNDSLWWKL